MFTSVAHARQMSGIATSTITRFLITHPEYAGEATAPATVIPTTRRRSVQLEEAEDGVET